MPSPSGFGPSAFKRRLPRRRWRRWTWCEDDSSGTVRGAVGSRLHARGEFLGRPHLCGLCLWSLREGLHRHVGNGRLVDGLLRHLRLVRRLRRLNHLEDNRLSGSHWLHRLGTIRLLHPWATCVVAAAIRLVGHCRPRTCDLCRLIGQPCCWGCLGCPERTPACGARCRGDTCRTWQPGVGGSHICRRWHPACILLNPSLWEIPWLCKLVGHGAEQGKQGEPSCGAGAGHDAAEMATVEALAMNVDFV